MKRILISLSVIAVVAAIAIGGTVAYFFDTETSTGNTFTAGTLDLSVPSPQAQTGFLTTTPTVTKTIEIYNEAPGNTGTGAVRVNNVGSLPGELDVAVASITNIACSPNGRNDGTEYCDDSGDLGGQATMGLYLDLDESRSFNAGDVEILVSGTTVAYDATSNTTVEENTINSYTNAWNVAPATLDAVGGANNNTNLVINWTIPTGATNDIQGDGLTFNVNFTLEQADRD